MFSTSPGNNLKEIWKKKGMHQYLGKLQRIVMSLFAIDIGKKSEMGDTVQINEELKEVTLIVANQHQYMLIKFVNIACYIFMKLKI